VATALSSGAASITIPPNSLAVGNLEQVTVTYNGDTNYAPGTTYDYVTVTAAQPGLTLSGSNMTLTAGATTQNSELITLTPTNGFNGIVTLTARITAAPANAVDEPTLSFGSTSPVNLGSGSVGSASLTVSTTAPSFVMIRPAPGHGIQWLGGAGSVLACVLLLVVPGRRQWQRWLGLFAVCLALLGGISACGGGGSGGGGGGGGGSPGTTVGVYTIGITSAKWSMRTR
jgi:hypothetical protein